jgi:AGZA family xanthine/uracil permease-like MFS transporter
MAIIGFLVIVALDRLKVRGALLIGILLVTVLSFVFGGNHFSGIFAAPPSIAPTFLQLDIKGAISMGLLNVVLVFFLVELFDATGTLMGVATRAGLMKDGKMERLNKALMADSTAIVAGSLLGTSSTTAYIESAAGVQAGGRTGLTAVAIAVLFLLCLFIAPLAGVVPAYATAPALFFVACLMLRELVHIDWEDTTVRAGRDHRAGDALHLLHRQWPGAGLHQLCRIEAADGSYEGCISGNLDHRRDLPVQDHLPRR